MRLMKWFAKNASKHRVDMASSLAGDESRNRRRGRFVELMGESMLPPGEADNLFVVGMFSLIDQLLGVPMAQVLAKVQLPEAVQQAILSRGGVYGPFLSLAEACELDNGEAACLAEALLLSADQVNAAHLRALAWSHDVTLTEAA